MARYNSFPLGISFVLRYFFQIVRFLFFSTIKRKYVTCPLFPMELKLLKIRRIRVRLISLEFNNRRNIIEIPRWRNTIELILSLSWEREKGRRDKERERERVFLLRIGKREFPARRLSQRSILYRVYRFPPLVTGMYISRSFVVGKNVFSTCTKIHFFSSTPLRPTRVPKRPLSQPFSWPWTLSPCIFVVRRWNNNCLFTSSHRFYVKIKL